MLLQAWTVLGLIGALGADLQLAFPGDSGELQDPSHWVYWQTAHGAGRFLKTPQTLHLGQDAWTYNGLWAFPCEEGCAATGTCVTVSAANFERATALELLRKYIGMIENRATRSPAHHFGFMQVEDYQAVYDRLIDAEVLSGALVPRPTKADPLWIQGAVLAAAFPKGEPRGLSAQAWLEQVREAQFNVESVLLDVTLGQPPGLAIDPILVLPAQLPYVKEVCKDLAGAQKRRPSADPYLQKLEAQYLNRIERLARK